VGIALRTPVVQAVGDAALIEALQELWRVPVLIESKAVTAEIAPRGKVCRRQPDFVEVRAADDEPAVVYVV
jgi:hypothetical protein